MVRRSSSSIAFSQANLFHMMSKPNLEEATTKRRRFVVASGA
jgi:hypothetical protein